MTKEIRKKRRNSYRNEKLSKAFKLENIPIIHICIHVPAHNRLSKNLPLFAHTPFDFVRLRCVSCNLFQFPFRIQYSTTIRNATLVDFLAYELLKFMKRHCAMSSKMEHNFGK